MVKLRRTVRFCINPDQDPHNPVPGSNGYAGKPAMHGLGRYYELTLFVQGEPDPQTGYLITIKQLDQLAHEHLIPVIAHFCRDAPQTNPLEILPTLHERAQATLPILTGLRWNLTPTYSIEATGNPMSKAIIRQQFDFAAAHRLHVTALSDEENSQIFGRCNNPSGHGHNYRVETAFNVEPAAESPVALAELEALVGRVLIDPFDHKHLNEDTGEFATTGGLNPSVENIARVFYERLDGETAAELGERCSLHEVTVWETDRTSATYPSVQDR